MLEEDLKVQAVRLLRLRHSPRNSRGSLDPSVAKAMEDNWSDPANPYLIVSLLGYR